MKGNHTQPSAGFKQCKPIEQRLAQRCDFIVDGNAHGLKRTARRVPGILAAHCTGDGLVHRAHQIARHLKRLLRTHLNNDLCDTSPPALIGIVIQRLADVLLRHGVEPISRGKAGALIHAHIQQRILMIGKPALRRVQLIGGHTQIQQRTIQRWHPIQQRDGIMKIAMYCMKARIAF